MQLVTTGHVTTHSRPNSGLLVRLLSACGVFATNVVNRFHEHADARLAEELTVLGHRRRLLGQDVNQAPQRRASSVTIVRHTCRVD